MNIQEKLVNWSFVSAPYCPISMQELQENHATNLGLKREREIRSWIREQKRQRQERVEA
jgi:hypothetical protein